VLMVQDGHWARIVARPEVAMWALHGGGPLSARIQGGERLRKKAWFESYPRKQASGAKAQLILGTYGTTEVVP
jgi:hypothetical protein